MKNYTTPSNSQIAIASAIINAKRAMKRKANKIVALATAKTVNYTPEQTAKMVSDYAEGVSVESIAMALGKSVRSVTAKLSRERVYVAKTYKTKTGEAVVKKDELADKLTMLADLTEAEADSLTKANKTALAKIVALLSKE